MARPRRGPPGPGRRWPLFRWVRITNTDTRQPRSSHFGIPLVLVSIGPIGMARSRSMRGETALSLSLQAWHSILQIRSRFYPPRSRLTLRAFRRPKVLCGPVARSARLAARSEEHTSELQSQSNLVCRLLLEKKNEAGFLRVS